MSMREIMFTGPAGRLEGKYFQQEDRSAPVAVVLHPHPLHGGTMNNKVTYHTFHTFVNNGFSVLRFNFRGVGKSSGVFDHGIGEMTDAAAALDWLQAQNPESSHHWLAGFSFGSWVALQLLMRRPEISAFVAISPPANSHDFNFLSPCPAQGLIIQGTADTVVAEADVYSLYDKLDKQRNSNIEYIPIDKADHFYTKHMDQFIDALDGYIKPRLNMEQTTSRSKRDRRRRQLSTDEAE